jgi:K+-transporting ATPase ATPase A chain
MLPTLALAGALATRTRNDRVTGMLAPDGPMFVLLLASVVLLVGALTFLPADGLGPIAEHLLMRGGLTR